MEGKINLNKTYNSEKEKPKRPTFEFKDSDSAQEYLEWKGAVPIEFRRLVEGNLKNAEIAPSQTGLPLTVSFPPFFGPIFLLS